MLGIKRLFRRPDEYWRMIALQMAQDSHTIPAETQAVLERAEEYLKFLRTGKAHPPL